MTTQEAPQTKAGNMSLLEFAANWTGVAAVLLTAVAAVAGVFAWYFSSRLADLKDAALKKFQSESKVAVASSNARASEAAEKVAQAELQIETLRSENLKLQAKIAPRRLTSVQKESLSKFLSDDPGAIAIVSSIFDGESSDFADDFELAFRAAHWETVRIKNRTVVEYGVSVGTLEGTALGDTNRVADALRSIGISHRVRTFGEYDKNRISPSLERNVLYLVIDKKPVSFEPPVNVESPK